MTTTPLAPTLRRDARRNRDAILDAARDLFAEAGDVPMYEIARRAGVGQATLYRHFPDREAVAAALATEQLERLEHLADSHCGDPDAFFVLIRGIVDAQARCHTGLRALLGDDGDARSELARLGRRLAEIVRGPLRDAKAAGMLRADVTLEDVRMLVAMIHGALGALTDPAARAATATRALGFAINGLATRPTGPSADAAGLPTGASSAP
jgi:AcrR family transcriptional regulator